jgi:hypothetical protein
MTTKTETTHLWTNETLLPDEHRIYRLAPQVGVMKGTMNLHGVPARLLNDERGMWAVADNSGRFPDETDDGVLWLDFTTTIMLGKMYDNSIHVPLISPGGKAGTFVTTAAGMLVLSDLFRWTMNADGGLYRAVRW